MMETKPSRYVQRPLDDARSARLWDGVQHRMASRRAQAMAMRRGLSWTVGLGLAGLAGVFVTFLVMHQTTPTHQAGRSDVVSSWKGAVLNVGPKAQSVRLADGSMIVGAPQSRVRICSFPGSRVCLRVEQGRVRFSVRHGSDKPFIVKAADIQVRVVGTRFLVEHEVHGSIDRVGVVVEEGVVEVAGPGVRRRLTGGEHWSRTIEQGRTPRKAGTSPVPPSLHGSPAASRPSVRRKVRPGTDARSSRSVPSAEELWRSARDARRNGHFKEAARMLVRLIKTYPHGGQAAFAAFALAKIRMDALGDAAGASSPLRKALAAGSSMPFHEDALARLAQVYHRTGRQDACRRVHQRYLKRYPRGVYRRRLSRICPIGNHPRHP